MPGGSPHARTRSFPSEARASLHLPPPSAPSRPPHDRDRVHELRDASGVLVALHERHDHADGSQDFTWRQPDGRPGLGGLPVIDLPLFGIERLDGTASTVVIVEGEKCAEALWSVGIAAVATVTGAASTPNSRSSPSWVAGGHPLA